MSSVSLPVTRSTGRALLVGSPAARVHSLDLLRDMGFSCVEADDPYAATVELSVRPMIYRSIVLSLQSLYPEELALISTIKQRFSHIEIWLADTDGRQGAMIESMRLGADGLLAEDGLHRLAIAEPVAPAPPPQVVPAEPAAPPQTPALSAPSRADATPSKPEVPLRNRNEAVVSRVEHRPAARVAAPSLPVQSALPRVAPATAEPSGANGAGLEQLPSNGGHAKKRRRDRGPRKEEKPRVVEPMVDCDADMCEPVLTAEELRALLHDGPVPQANEEEYR